MSKQSVAVSKVFDPVKLDQMTEPLSVRVEKVRGGVRTPIPLPAAEEGGVQGANWSKEDVSGLEAWLVNEWSGGGTYAISVMDATQPVPQKHEWQIFYSPADYPEKVPPTLSAAMAPDRSPSPSTPTQVRPMGSFPSAFPSGMPIGMSSPQPVQQPAPYFVPQQAAPRTDFGGVQAQASFAAQSAQAQLIAAQAAADAERRRLEDQLKEMQASLARAREEQLQAQHRQDLERAEARMRAEQQAQNEKFSKLEQLIASLAQAQARPASDPALEALKEQNRALAQQAADERREREAERREREMKEMIQRSQEESRRQMEAMQAQVVAQQQAAAQAAALAAATANKGPDPMLMFIQENSRQQVEAVKEQARNQAAQMQQLQSFMMRPQDIMQMAKESSNGIDQATSQLTRAYTDIFNMQRQAVETVMQLQGGGGSETVALIEKGLERASSFAERFIGGKTKEAVSAQQSQAQMAQAQAAAMQAQAQAMTVQAHMAERAAQGGLNGPAVAAVAGPSGDTQVSQTSSAPTGGTPTDGWSTGPVPPISAIIPSNVPRRLGRTDAEWFGPLTDRVIELRLGVGRFIESLKMEPHRLKEDGTVDGVEPEQAASAIMQAASLVMQQQIPIAAMMDLLGQGRVADFMDVLLPDAPQPYRDEVAQMVLSALQGDDEDEDDEDDDEDDDDEDNDDINVNNNPNPPVKAAPSKKNGTRARA